MAGIVENQPAYVLHRRPFKESSYILDVITLNYGRLSLVANGAGKQRKGGMNLAAILQPFQPLRLSWSGRGNLKTLRSPEVASQAIFLSDESLYCGYYLNELLLSLTLESDPVPEVFAFYGRALDELKDGKAIEIALRRFEFDLLASLGLLPSFDVDVNGCDIEPAQSYALLPLEGFVVAGLPEAQYSAFHLQGSDVIRMKSCQTELVLAWEAQTRVAAKRVMRSIIDAALQGRELKSRQMFKQLKFQKQNSFKEG